MRPGGPRRHRHRRRIELARDRAAEAAAARSRRATNMTADWSTRWRARCRARSRLRPRRRRVRAPAMFGSARRGRSTGCRRRSSRSTRAEVNDERIGCLLVGPGMGDVPQVLTLALTTRAPKVIDADAIATAGRARTAEGPGRDPHPARRRIQTAVRRDRGIEAGARAGGGRAVRRGGRLQGAGHARRLARWAAGLRAAGAGVAGERRHRRRARRDDRRDAGAGAARFRGGLRRGLAARPSGRDRRAADDRRRSRRRDSRRHRRL